MPAILGAVALLALVLAVVLILGRRRTERELKAARTELDSLRAQMAAIAEQLARPGPATSTKPDRAEYVITHVGDELPGNDRPPAEVRIDRALFADLVLRETVVRTASLAHGLRTALAPETRNRIRFEMKREVRRARKVRRAQLKEARREWEARQRAGLGETGFTSVSTSGSTTGDAA